MATSPTYAATGGSRGPRRHTPLLIAGAIVLAAVLIGASVLAGFYVSSQRFTATSGPTAKPTVTAPPTTTPAPTATAQPTPKPPPTPLAGFTAGSIAGGAPVAGQVTDVGSVRAAAQNGYDRFVLDLGQSPLQQYEVRTQATPKFTLDAKGEVVTLDGSRGIQIVLLNASNHAAFSGATDVRTGLPAIREARLIGDFEGVVSWALGVNGPGFVRVMALANPNRLVVDGQA
jgi:hypothetical protein